MNTNLTALGQIGEATSAVVLLFCPLRSDPTSPGIVITKRTTSVRTHKGQLSFPGGRIERHEAVVAAALREVEEEIGLPQDVVRPLGFLPPIQALDRSPVVCIVAQTSSQESAFILSKDEVERVYVVPVPLLTRSRAMPFRFNVFSRWRESYVYAADGLNIWGLTAKMLYDADLG